MAQIDVSELLNDPDFTDSATLIRRAATVNEYGETVLTETSTTIAAVIQDGDPEVLARLPDGARWSDYIRVYYRGVLAAESPNGYADIIVFNGRRFIVRTVDESFSNWGAGFTMAHCVTEAAQNA